MNLSKNSIKKAKRLLKQGLFYEDQVGRNAQDLMFKYFLMTGGENEGTDGRDFLDVYFYGRQAS